MGNPGSMCPGHINRADFRGKSVKNQQQTEDNEDKEVDEERTISTSFADWNATHTTKAQA